MNRSEDDIHVKEKVNEIIRNRLPGFASRYFSYNMDLKVPKQTYICDFSLTYMLKKYLEMSSGKKPR